MNRTCIAIVDASRARLFAFTRSAEIEGLREELSEVRTLVNPARRQHPGELFTDRAPSGRTGGVAYGIDDHREAHVDEIDSGFAREITAQLVDVLRATGAERLIVCASPRMLGELRAAGPELRRGGLEVDEIPRNLTRLSPRELREQLAAYGLLPTTPSPRVVEHRA